MVKNIFDLTNQIFKCFNKISVGGLLILNGLVHSAQTKIEDHFSNILYVLD